MRKKEKIIGAIVLLIISFIALGLGYYKSNRKNNLSEEMFVNIDEYKNENQNKESDNKNLKDNEVDSRKVDNNEKEKNTIVVDIKGAVKNPKEYELKEGSRVRDLINLAGGLTEDADEDKIYYSKVLSDEDCIRVYKIGEADENEGGTVASEEKSSGINKNGIININKATMEELQTLPGIGEVKAKNIIAYREGKGKFKSVDELSNVDGIGVKTVDKLRDMVDIKWVLR